MLGLVLPDVIFAVFIDIARAMPLSVGRVVLAVLVGGWLAALALVLRAVALRVDVALALAARRRSTAPGALAVALGLGGVWLARGAGLVAALLVVAQFAVSLRIAGYLAQSDGFGGIARVAGQFTRLMLPS